MNKIALHSDFSGSGPAANHYSAEALTYMFFGAPSGIEIKKPGRLGRFFRQLMSGIDTTPDDDSVNNACRALEEHGFSALQIGSFLSVIQQEANSLIHEYGQAVYGIEYDSEENPLDLYYSRDFFMGVKLEGERLDNHYYSRERIFTAVKDGMERLIRDFPYLAVPARRPLQSLSRSATPSTP